MNKEEMFLSHFNKMFGMRRTLNKLKLKEYPSEYHFTEIRCIGLIGMIEDANVTKLSEAFYMTRGGISKTIKKLLHSGAVESYQRPDNKKEIYFKLTEEGQRIYKTYESFSNAQKERDKGIFNQLSEEEKDVVIKFLEKFNQHLEDQIGKEEIPNCNDDSQFSLDSSGDFHNHCCRKHAAHQQESHEGSFSRCHNKKEE